MFIVIYESNHFPFYNIKNKLNVVKHFKNTESIKNSFMTIDQIKKNIKITESS